MKAMKKSMDRNPMPWLAGACGLTMLLMIPWAASAQQAAAARQEAFSDSQALPLESLMPGVAPESSQADAQPAEEESPQPGKSHIGLKVHGHWILQVKNADGTLGERREFENSLVTDEHVTSGDQYLAGLLSGNITPGSPGIAFISSVPSDYAADPSGFCPNYNFAGVAPCYFFTTPQSIISAYAAGNANFGGGAAYTEPYGLETGLSVKTQFSPPVAWVLSGNYTVPAGLTTIAAVQSMATYCAPVGPAYVGANPGISVLNFLNGTATDRNADYTAKQCTASAFPAALNTEWPFMATLTSTTVTANGVPAPLTVTTGQIVTVIVTISFS